MGLERPTSFDIGSVLTAALCCATAALLLTACGGGNVPRTDAVPTGGPPGVRSFVLSNVFIAAPPEEPGACPQLSDGPLELFLKSLPPAEQTQYATVDRREALMKLMNQRVGFRFAHIPPDPKTGVIGP